MQSLVLQMVTCLVPSSCSRFLTALDVIAEPVIFFHAERPERSLLLCGAHLGCLSCFFMKALCPHYAMQLTELRFAQSPEEQHVRDACECMGESTVGASSDVSRGSHKGSFRVEHRRSRAYLANSKSYS